MSDDLSSTSTSSLEDDLRASMQAMSPEAPETSTEPTEATSAPEATSEPATEDTPSGEPEDGLALARYADAMLGSSYSSKYKNDQEAILGWHNAVQRLSQRDEDAAYGRQLKEYESEFRSFLESRQRPAQAPPAEQLQQTNLPTIRDYERWKNEIAQKGEQASPETIRRFTEANEKIQEAMLNLAFRPHEVLKPVVKPEVEQLAQQAQQYTQQLAQQQQQMAWQNWIGENRSWIFEGGEYGKPLTPYAQRFMGHLQNAAQRQMPIDAGFQYAHAMAGMEQLQQQQQAQQAVAPKVEAPKKHATRQPAIAAPANAEPSYQDLVDKMDLEQHLLYNLRKAQASAGSVT